MVPSSGWLRLYHTLEFGKNLHAQDSRTSSSHNFPPTLLEALGRPIDPDEEDEVIMARVGPCRAVLRRECHGVLRRLQLDFDQAGRRDSPDFMRESVVIGVHRTWARSILTYIFTSTQS